jgi:VanZ family protein
MRTKTLLRWLPALVVMAVIFALSSTPSQDLPNFGLLDTLVKKGGHFVGYAILALTYWYGLKTPDDGDRLRPYSVAFALAVLYAVSDEYHQSFVPGRHPSWVDAFLIDGSGAAVMLGLVRWRLARMKSRREL